MTEGAFQLEPASAAVLEIVAEHANHALRRNLRAGLANFLIVHQDLACKNESLCAFARRGEATIYKKFVESDFQNQIPDKYFVRRTTTKVLALAVVQSAGASLG